MAFIKKLFNDNYLQYASYVIKDRAIPDIEDGLKPVQRRIMHSLFEMDDGKFHKVANVVGHCMKYHPHGDASIYSALVVLANKDLFIDKQGNFGNLFTGDEASAARYIECRATPLAKDVFYNPSITEYAESYDGRNREPVYFPAKIPVILGIGAEGIAVGMSTRILPHNLVEVLKAEVKALRGEKFKLYPDFPTGGLADISGYEDGNGKVLVRAKLDLSDPKRIVIRELPFGSTSESLIASVEAAARSGRIKIAGISDFTTDRVEIEIKMQRGVYAEETVNALYAFTECEQAISCNFLVIKDDFPCQMTVTEVVKYHAERLLETLKAELKLERGEQEDKLHARTLERIFIEERVYKGIEKMKSAEGVTKAVFDGLKPFAKEIAREVTPDDIERLLKIPIRRISLYDIEKARAEMEEIKARIREIDRHLKHLTDYAVAYLEGVIAKIGKAGARKTEVKRFTMVDQKEVATRDNPLRYDSQSGYLGTSVSGGQELLRVSTFDRILVIRRTGIFTVMDAPEKAFVDSGMLHVRIVDKEELPQATFSIFYKEAGTGYPCVKRFRIEGFILNRDYLTVPDGAEVIGFTTQEKFTFTAFYVKKPRLQVKEEKFKADEFAVRGLKAQGLHVAHREIASIDISGSGELAFAPPERGEEEETAPKKAAAGATGTARKAAGKSSGAESKATAKPAKKAAAKKAPAAKKPAPKKRA